MCEYFVIALRSQKCVNYVYELGYEKEGKCFSYFYCYQLRV